MPKPGTMTSRKQAPTFNELLAELEAVVAQLEGGDTSLDTSLKEFEKGVGLARAAQKLLADAEQKVLLFTESEDGPKATPFDAGDDA